MATIKINNVALINSGIVIANIVTVEIVISGSLSLQRAVTIPSIKAIGIPIKICNRPPAAGVASIALQGLL